MMESDTTGIRLPNSAEFIAYMQEIANMLKMEFLNEQ